MKYKVTFSTLFYLLFISSIVFLSACSNEKQTIKIGIAGTMSGIYSDLSVSGRRGIELATEEFNQAGGLNGRKVELVAKDDKNDAKIALDIDKEFIKEDIPVVIGHYTSGMMVNSMDYLKDKNILFLSPTISADTFSNIDDNFIRFIATTKEQSVVIANMANKNGDKKFAIIYDLENKGFNEALLNNFKKQLEENKGEVVTTKTFSANTNFDSLSLAKSIDDAGVQAVLIIASSSDNANITQQIRKIGCKVQIYSPLWSNTVDLIKKGGSSIDGMFIVGGIDLYNNSEKFKKFKENYFEKYGEDPTFSSKYSYEAATSLFKAMKLSPDLKPNTIKNNIIKISKFEGIEDEFQIDRFGDNIRNYLIFRIENDQLRKVE